jgi:hypothetical protein
MNGFEFENTFWQVHEWYVQYKDAQKRAVERDAQRRQLVVRRRQKKQQRLEARAAEHLTRKR